MARIWDAATHAAVGAPLAHDLEVWWAAFSPDGSRIVTAGQENIARIWDARTGALLGVGAEHRGVIHTAMFSPDGTRIVTASDDRTARVWDVPGGRPLGPPLEHAGGVLWAAFSPDGSRILTTDGGRTASVWSLPRPLEMEPQRIADWLADRTGLVVNGRGGIVVLDDAAWRAARRDGRPPKEAGPANGETPPARDRGPWNSGGGRCNVEAARRDRRRVATNPVGIPMNLRPLLLASCALVLLADASPADEPKETFWVIPHTHWEGAVFKTREEYLDMGLANILKAMRLLREQPSFRFTLDQVAYVRPFLERFPAEEADFRRFLAEGRLQLAGALDVMPDDNMPGGETFVRQMLYGKGYYRDKLGVDVTTGWQLDTFGHHAQMPQLMRQGGYKSFWFFRGVPRQDFPSEFVWEGIDGTRIDAYWLPYGYGIVYPTPKDAAAFRESMKARFHLLDANSKGAADRAGPSGADVSEPEEHLVPYVEAFNKDPNRPFTIKVAVPAEFEAVAARRTDRTVFKGELNPIFQGIYSSRIELKEWMRTIERQLLTAEKLGAIAGWLGQPADPKAILAAWEPALFNQTHDLASGVMTDHVYEDTIRGYEYSLRRSNELIDASWNAIAARIDTRGPGTPVVVFNPLGWKRSDIAEVEIGFGEGGVNGVELTDPEGGDVPSQILDASRYADGGLKTARIAFIARDVPALGYATYHAAPGRRKVAAKPGPPASFAVVLENDLYRVTLDRATGAIDADPRQAGRLGRAGRTRECRGAAAGPRRPVGAQSRPRRR